jgi:DNA polymerase-3 subunit alpha
MRLAPTYNIKPLVGIDFRNGIDPCYVGIARNNNGFEQLNQFLSHHLGTTKKAFPVEAPLLEDCIFIYPMKKVPDRALHPQEYIGTGIKDLSKIAIQKDLPKSKLVLMQPATFRNQTDYNIHKLLRAVDKNTLYTKIRETDYASPHDLFWRQSTLLSHYEDHPYIIHNTRELAEQCQIGFDFHSGKPKNQKTYTGSVRKDVALIRRLCRDNLSYRYIKPTDPILSRIDKELNVIVEKGFVSYFLINWDITTYARNRNYFYVGRGSGANSIVAYLLQITDVDPIELDLYFERFINLYRENPPDFDIDFSWKDREDVTQYIFDRFPNTALLATYNTFQYRAAIRELGKVFGLPKAELDHITRGRPVFERLDKLSKLVIQYAELIRGLPSHLSVHAGGIIISEKPVQYYTATFVPPKGFQTTQFDMVVAEDIGLYKFDILGQRGLAKIKDSLQIIRDNNPNHDLIDIHDIKKFKQDTAIKSMLREGKAIGCFYVESPAMRMLLKKLCVDHYLGLVAASSIIRPGVAKSGMMREYILRERFPEKRKEAHPVLADIMPDTYGIMVYQEDVIKVAHYFAGLTLGEADVLRRGMSGKYRSRAEFDRVKDKFFENCAGKGYSTQLAAEVWRQIESFAGYAFAKGHSASYAVESYQSLFLKGHYPLEYMVATINNGGGFYRAELYIHEARMCGGRIHEPCVNTSDYGCIILGQDVYLGLGFVRSVESDFVHDMVRERKYAGRYEDLTDFTDRTQVSLETLCTLIRINAFRFTGKTKKELLWQAHQLLNRSSSPQVNQAKLFRAPVKDYNLSLLTIEKYEDAFDQIELLGFSLINPFELLNDSSKSGLTANDLPTHKNQEVSIHGYLITVKDTNTSKGERMNFGTFIDIKGQFIDTVHFPLIARDYPFRGAGIYNITGRVMEEFGFHTIEVTRMEKLAYITDPRFNEEQYMINGNTYSSRRRKSLKKATG